MRVQRKRNTIIAIAIVISIILYLSGVFSGLYASKMIQQRTESDIKNLKNETRSDLLYLKSETREDFDILSSYIKFLDGNLQEMQLERAFQDTLSPEESCIFSNITLIQLTKQFNYYWDRLPFRIEEYEAKNPSFGDEYILLKQQYTQLSLRTWLYAENKNKRCDGDLVVILYLYSAECPSCIKQGEILDNLQKSIESQGRDVMIFTVDLNSESSIIKYIRESHDITDAPALLISDHIYQGRVFEEDEIINVIGDRK